MARPMTEHEKKVLEYVKTLSLDDIKRLTKKHFGEDLTHCFGSSIAIIIYEQENL